jgi:hypothetical protein
MHIAGLEDAIEDERRIACGASFCTTKYIYIYY